MCHQGPWQTPLAIFSPLLVVLQWQSGHWTGVAGCAVRLNTSYARPAGKHAGQMAGRSVHTLLTPPRPLPAGPTVQGAIHTDTSWHFTPTSYANHRQAGSLHCTWPLRNSSVMAPQVNKLNTCGLKSILSITTAGFAKSCHQCLRFNSCQQCWFLKIFYQITCEIHPTSESLICGHFTNAWIENFNSAWFLKLFYQIPDFWSMLINAWFLKSFWQCLILSVPDFWNRFKSDWFLT